MMFELENNLLLYFTSTHRSSSEIILRQTQNVVEKNTSSIEAMHQIKRQAYEMKEALLKGNLNELGHILDRSFEEKRKMATGISTERIEQIYATAKQAGAIGGKISGAGGGGFMTFYCPNNTKHRVIHSLSSFEGRHRRYQFTSQGVTSWRAHSFNQTHYEP